MNDIACKTRNAEASFANERAGGILNTWIGRSFLRACLTAVATAIPYASVAQERWPTKPLTWVVGYAPGGSTDVIARLMATSVGARLGQPVVIENKPGANSNIAAASVSVGSPEGHTFYFGTIANAINASLYRKLPYDFLKDLEPVSLVATSPNVLVVNPKALAATSVKDLIAHARSNPGRLNYASSGSGSSIHLSAELFKKDAEVHLVHVPYRGSAPAMTDLIGGQVHLMFDNLPSALPHIRAGRLRALGVTSATRSPSAPDIPTISESGLPGFNVEAWFALFAPANTPDPVRSALANAIQESLQQPEVRSRLLELGAIPAVPPPAGLRRFMQGEVSRWGEVVRFSGVTLD